MKNFNMVVKGVLAEDQESFEGFSVSCKASDVSSSDVVMSLYTAIKAFKLGQADKAFLAGLLTGIIPEPDSETFRMEV